MTTLFSAIIEREREQKQALALELQREKVRSAYRLALEMAKQSALLRAQREKESSESSSGAGPNSALSMWIKKLATTSRPASNVVRPDHVTDIYTPLTRKPIEDVDLETRRPMNIGPQRPPVPTNDDQVVVDQTGAGGDGSTYASAGGDGIVETEAQREPVSYNYEAPDTMPNNANNVLGGHLSQHAVSDISGPTRMPKYIQSDMNVNYVENVARRPEPTVQPQPQQYVPFPNVYVNVPEPTQHVPKQDDYVRYNPFPDNNGPESHVPVAQADPAPIRFVSLSEPHEPNHQQPIQQFQPQSEPEDEPESLAFPHRIINVQPAQMPSLLRKNIQSVPKPLRARPVVVSQQQQQVFRQVPKPVQARAPQTVPQNMPSYVQQPPQHVHVDYEQDQSQYEPTDVDPSYVEFSASESSESQSAADSNSNSHLVHMGYDGESDDGPQLYTNKKRAAKPEMLLTYPDHDATKYFMVKLRKKVIKTTVNDGMPPPLDTPTTYASLGSDVQPPTMAEAMPYAGNHKMYTEVQPSAAQAAAQAGQPPRQPADPDQTVFMLSHYQHYNSPDSQPQPSSPQQDSYASNNENSVSVGGSDSAQPSPQPSSGHSYVSDPNIDSVSSSVFSNVPSSFAHNHDHHHFASGSASASAVEPNTNSANYGPAGPTSDQSSSVDYSAQSYNPTDSRDVASNQDSSSDSDSYGSAVSYDESPRTPAAVVPTQQNQSPFGSSQQRPTLVGPMISRGWVPAGYQPINETTASNSVFAPKQAGYLSEPKIAAVVDSPRETHHLSRGAFELVNKFHDGYRVAAVFDHDMKPLYSGAPFMYTKDDFVIRDGSVHIEPAKVPSMEEQAQPSTSNSDSESTVESASSSDYRQSASSLSRVTSQITPGMNRARQFLVPIPGRGGKPQAYVILATK